MAVEVAVAAGAGVAVAVEVGGAAGVVVVAAAPGTCGKRVFAGEAPVKSGAVHPAAPSNQLRLMNEAAPIYGVASFVWCCPTL